ncbi:serine/threonine-protein kinase PCRK1 isoform X3 [Diospyros lotus]|uniref:serine/threonine-protein kinase PCRK1 isoform X3 n=1 Tax=Diospyros lotus TaxID=55363 RepID=UPI002259ED96|nr:serine/threonine-protein kinase PCRK1 isoform X3 [Diospyros lotus]
MKCFHFTNGERREDDEGTVSGVSRTSKVSWARSFSVASSSVDTRRSEYDSDSRDFSDSFSFYDLLVHRRANDLRVFAFSELKSATRGFSRALMIGEGGFGSVYRGVIGASGDGNGPDSKMDVAIKQLNRNGFQACPFFPALLHKYGSQGHKEWINEVNFLGVVKHPNLVKLVGYCAEDDERGIQRLLVYELMHNKSLEDHLLSRVGSPLPWKTRLAIAQDAARGLAYLHEEMDFQVVGTVGYAAPEYVQTGRLTAKSDVWSFGVVLYELITGRRAVERNLPRSEQKLLEWVRPYISDSKKFYLILDPRLEGQYCIKSAQKLAHLANKCLVKQPKSRPKMSVVVEMLGNIISEASLQDDSAPQPSKDDEGAKEETEEEAEPAKEESNIWSKVFDFKDIVNFRNKSIGKLDWRNWTPGIVRTW